MGGGCCCWISPPSPTHPPTHTPAPGQAWRWWLQRVSPVPCPCWAGSQPTGDLGQSFVSPSQYGGGGRLGGGGVAGASGGILRDTGGVAGGGVTFRGAGVTQGAVGGAQGCCGSGWGVTRVGFGVVGRCAVGVSRGGGGQGRGEVPYGVTRVGPGRCPVG